MARQRTAAAIAEQAKRYVMEALGSKQGIVLQKHGRNGKTTSKSLYSTEESFQTLTWGKTVYDLRNMEEVCTV